MSPFSQSCAATAGRIEIAGLSSIERDEMLDMLGFREGDLIDPEIIKESIKSAFRKGIFDDISINASDSDPSVVTVQVREKDMLGKVSVQGMYPLSTRKVRDLLLMKEGEVMRYDLIDQTAADLKSSFAEFGFPEAKIDMIALRDEKRYHHITLTVSIDAGSAQVIREIRVIGTSVVSAGDLRLSVNDVYDQIKLRKEIQRLREQLKKDNYYSPVIGSYSFEHGILTIPIEPGKRLLTITEGNSALSTKRLEKEMPFFDGEVFSDEAVDEAVSRMLSLYHREGYSQAQIAPVVRSDQQQIEVIFFIYEGRKTRVRTIRFTGVTLPFGILQSVLELKEGGPFNPDLRQGDRDTLREYYAALGYLEVTVGEIEIRTAEGADDVDLIIPVEEGMRTTIGALDIKGVGQGKKEELLALISVREGQPYNEVEISDSRFRIIDYYARDGFAAIDVLVERLIEDHRAKVSFIVTEGRRMTIGKIVIAGNARTKYRVIKRELAHDLNSPYSFHILGQERQKLYKLGLFDDIDIESFDTEGGKVDLLVRVKEGNAGSFEFGFGFAEYERFRSFFEVGYRNLFGMNRQGQFRAEVSSLEKRLVLQYYEPWLLGTTLPLRIIFLREERKELTIPGRVVRYELERYTLTAGIERKLFDRIKGEVYYEFSLVRTTNVQPDVILSREDVGSLAISSVRTSLVYDSRDNPFEPRKGVLAGITAKIASPVFLSETHFAKITAYASFYQQLHKRVVLGLSARGGVAYGFGQTTELPIVERYFLGGRSSVRGYEQDTLGPKGSDGNPTGGNVFVMGSVELRTAIGRSFSIVPFIDFGNVWVKAGDFSPGDIQYTAGIGLRYATPVGPLRVDYGYKLSRDTICVDMPAPLLQQCTPESRGALHFSIGHAF